MCAVVQSLKTLLNGDVIPWSRGATDDFGLIAAHDSPIDVIKILTLSISVIHSFALKKSFPPLFMLEQSEMD